MATRKLPSTRMILSGDYDREIYEAMARAMFVSDWASREEEKKSFRGWNGAQLMDHAPKTSQDALLAARALAAAIIKDNNVKSLTDLYARALNAGGEGDAGKFGHYLAMEAMGDGVSWYDDGNPRFGMKLPHFEYYSGRGRVAQKLGHSTGKASGHKHTNTGKLGFDVRPFFGPVAGKQNPKAHGGNCVVEHCPCGATRMTNVNGKHTERGPWSGGGSKAGHASGYDGWNWDVAKSAFEILNKVEKHPGTRFGALASNLVMERRVEGLLADGRLTRGLESVSRLAGPKLFLTAAGSAFLADYRARLKEIATPAHKRTNKEGLTFEEWLNAARVPTGGASLGTAMSNQKLIRAWKAGEDPTEYRAGYSSGDSTEQLRARIAKALKWTVNETESFSFPQLASFVRGKDAQLDANLARHIESASHWFKPARRGRRKGLASGSKAKGGIYASTFCNRGHYVATGRPVKHECIVIPLAALKAEMEGDYTKANEIMSKRPRGRFCLASGATKTKAKKTRMKAKASCSCTATVTRRKASKKSKKPATKK